MHRGRTTCLCPRSPGDLRCARPRAAGAVLRELGAVARRASSSSGRPTRPAERSCWTARPSARLPAMLATMSARTARGARPPCPPACCRRPLSSSSSSSSSASTAAATRAWATPTVSHNSCGRSMASTKRGGRGQHHRRLADGQHRRRNALIGLTATPAFRRRYAASTIIVGHGRRGPGAGGGGGGGGRRQRRRALLAPPSDLAYTPPLARRQRPGGHAPPRAIQNVDV